MTEIPKNNLTKKKIATGWTKYKYKFYKYIKESLFNNNCSTFINGSKTLINTFCYLISSTIHLC